MPIPTENLRGLPAGPYSRVSRDMGKTGRSVAEQTTENRATCQQYGLTILNEYADDDRSASKYATKDRPDWERLLADINAGRIKVLVVWEPSRATRDRMVWAALAAVCEDREVYVCASGRVYDPTDPDDMFQLDLYFMLAVRESGVTRKRVNRAIRANAAAGRPHGKLTYGYRREYEVTDAGIKRFLRQVPDERTAPIVREIFTRWAAGEGASPIAHDLNRRGVPTPRGAGCWRHSTVGKILQVRTYRGERTLNGVATVEQAWEPIVTDDLWWRVQARLTDPTRPGGYDTTVKHLLSAIPSCGVCGASLTANSSNNKRPQYYCRDRFCVGVLRPPLDRYVTEVVLKFLEDDTRLRGDGDNPRIGQLTELIDGLQARLEAFTVAAASVDGPSPAAVAVIERELRPKITAAEQERARLRTRVELPDLHGRTLREAWHAPARSGLTLPEKRRMIRATVTVRVMPVGRHPGGFRTDRVIIEPR